MIRRHSTLSLACMLALGGSNACFAAGFGISAKSTSNLGNAFAGTAALAEDASVAYNNPAAMQQLGGGNFSIAIHNANPTAKFTDRGSNTSGNTTSTADAAKYFPSLYYVRELGGDVRFGLGIYSPFGLGLEYDDTWTGRYHTTSSEMRTLNISPSFSFKASDKLAIGAGIDLQYLDATLDSMVDIGTICYYYASVGAIPGGAATCAGAGLTPQGNDAKQSLRGDDWAMGFTLGMTYTFSEDTLMGAVLHSSARHDVDGTSTFTGVNPLMASIFATTPASLTVNTPETINLSLAHHVNDRLTVMGDYMYTRWSRMDELSVDFANSIPTNTTAFAWRDVSRYSIGMNYKASDTWLLRGGLSHDQSPVPNSSVRSPRVPDGDRNWLNVGFRYSANNRLSVDFAYAHIFTVNVGSNNSDALGHTLVGDYEVDSNYVSVQANWAMN